MADSLSTAILAIYVILAIPVLYLIVRHGRQGFLGWLFLFFFCTLRIVGGALAMKSSSLAASIISNVGLSPLLLATSGILHEARLYRIHKLDKKVEWLLVLFYHMLVVAGVALTAAGSAKMQDPQQPIDAIEKGEKIAKAGIVILAVSWAVLVAWAGSSFVAPRARNSPIMGAGTLLLASVCFSLVFIGIRVFYSLVTLFTRKAYLSPMTGSLAIRVVLSFLPELIATLAYIAAGFKTQGAAKFVPAEDDNSSSPRKHGSAPYV